MHSKKYREKIISGFPALPSEYSETYDYIIELEKTIDFLLELIE